MGFHHVAVATRDLEESHRFYTEAMGFDLVKVDVIPTSDGAGWARHLFYDTGNGELMALFDLHDPLIGDAYDPAISTGLGLPNWVNHIAFAADGLDDLDAKRERLVAHGQDVARIDHGWCTSIYANDPNGNMVEFCTLTRALTDADRTEALELLRAERPTVSKAEPEVDFFPGARSGDHAGVA